MITTTAHIDSPITDDIVKEIASSSPLIDRPYITISFAQSLDGSITTKEGETLQLSNRQSQCMTHMLRSIHNGILVGINTALTDDPRLTVRLVEGNNPRPVVLDSNLRISTSARLFQTKGVRPIIATALGANQERILQLVDKGAQVLRVPSTGNNRLMLKPLLSQLKNIGIDSLMVEGGAKVISSFINDQICDKMVITICPMLVGGINYFQGFSQSTNFNITKLKNVSATLLDGDIVVSGGIRWNDNARHKLI